MSTPPTDAPLTIAFQGAPGAFSDMAAQALFPGMPTMPCKTFAAAFAAVKSKAADRAVIPVDNTLAGRVADVHHLIPREGLYITGEFFQPIRHNLLVLPGTKIEEIRHVHSHPHALPQCAALIRALGIEPHVHEDTAGAARDVKAMNDPAHAAIASEMAAKIYGLEIIQADIQDESHNTTRFLVFSREEAVPPCRPGSAFLTSMIFNVRNMPAALYKTLGGFATNGLNMAKLESYVDEHFHAARFYCEVEGHPDTAPMKRALEELRLFTDDVRIIGAYPAHPFRNNL